MVQQCIFRFLTKELIFSFLEINEIENYLELKIVSPCRDCRDILADPITMPCACIRVPKKKLNTKTQNTII